MEDAKAFEEEYTQDIDDNLFAKWFVSFSSGILISLWIDSPVNHGGLVAVFVNQDWLTVAFLLVS